MENCACGMPRRQFWLWRDGNDGVHASRFAPTTGLVRTVAAATARDALWSALEGHVPKHNVTDVDDGTLEWVGRCQMDVAAALPAAAL